MKNINIAVVGGAGHVGMPLSYVLAKNFKVSIIDNSPNLNLLKKKKAPFFDYGINKFLKNHQINKNLKFFNNIREIKQEYDFIFIAVGTPVDQWGNPDIKNLSDLCVLAKKKIKKNGAILLRSTIIPGYTKKIYSELFIKSDQNIYYLPERIVQGNSFVELFKFPQIVGYEKIDNRQKKLLNEILRTFSPKIIYCKSIEAELSKLFSNFWRYCNFAISNQMYMIADQFDISLNNVLKILKDKYTRAAHIPGSGFTAGPCLYKDTKQLEFISDNIFDLGKSAISINENLVNFIAKKVYKKIEKKSNIYILGAAFKAQSDDYRDSLSFKLLKILKLKHSNIFLIDPYVKHKYVIRKIDTKNIKLNDIFVVATPHKYFKKILKLVDKKNIISPWEEFCE
jgi:UDP-N-acetyl-D-mannosaminuronic acid dehydrogenase